MDLEYVQAECLKWICDNNFKRVVIQFKHDDLKYSVQLINRIKESAPNPESLELYVTQSNSCCVDLFVTQHVSNIDGIIHVGNVCVSIPELSFEEITKPLLFVFGRPKDNSKQFEINALLKEIRLISNERSDKRVCLLYDTKLISTVTNLEAEIQKSDLKDQVEVADIHCPLSNWQTTLDNSHKFVRDYIDDARKLGFFVLSQPTNQYNCAIYLGQKLSIQLALSGPNEFWKISECVENEVKKEKVGVSKLLNKRIALVERLKNEEELKIGIIITNPLPNINRCLTELETYARARKHALYFISMIQVTDEYKIGNFDLCDAFVIVNSCSCSKILESLVFNRPILNVIEFKLACGFEVEYGRIVWPGTFKHEPEDAIINEMKRRVSDVSLALVHTRNVLLERCAQARINKWSGLDFKTTSANELDEAESLDIEDGLAGIASSYNSEPMKE